MDFSCLRSWSRLWKVSLFSMRLLDRLMTCPLACRFLGPCTQVHGRADPRHQGGEGVAGTPGACSQVFCHPISCTSARAWTDTPCCESSEPHTHHTQHTHTQQHTHTHTTHTHTHQHTHTNPHTHQHTHTPTHQHHRA